MAIGGQAVIEGVMIQNGHRVAVAVRMPGGAIAIRSLPGELRFPRLSRVPFLRGPFRLYHMLSLGLRALNLSAELATGEEEGSGGLAAAVGIVIGLAIALGGFVALPAYLVSHMPIETRILYSLVEGGIRLMFFLTYIWGIARLPDIRRVFQYHGAEHKAVHAYEEGAGYSLEAARSRSPLHARCGSAFLLLFVFVAIVVFSFLPAQPLWLRLAGRLALLPVVAGLTYEILQVGARHSGAWWMRVLIAPGLLLQRLTTQEPSDDQIEVAVAALRHVTEEAHAASASTDA